MIVERLKAKDLEGIEEVCWDDEHSGAVTAFPALRIHSIFLLQNGE